MCCLYCGKEVGALRLIRGSEFCSAAHQKKYGERLDKALHQIAAPEPPPAGIAPFRDQMPLKKGNCTPALGPWQASRSRTRIRLARMWSLSIDTSDPTGEGPTPVPAEPPVRREHAIPAAAPEAVASFVRSSAAPALAYRLRDPQFAARLGPIAVVDRPRYTPASCLAWVSAPAPEPVTSFVQSSPACEPVRCLRLPALELAPATAFSAELEAPPACERHMAVAAPEPVTAWVQAVAALSPALRLRFPNPVAGLARVWLPGPARSAAVPAPEPVTAWVEAVAALSPAVSLRVPNPVEGLGRVSMPGLASLAAIPAPEPVIAWVQAGSAPSLQYHPHALGVATLRSLPRLESKPAASTAWMPSGANAAVAVTSATAGATEYVPVSQETHGEQRIPAPHLTADLEPLAEAGEFIDPPAMCQMWMPAPGAEAVCREVRASRAAEAPAAETIVLPVFAVSPAATGMPGVAGKGPARRGEIVEIGRTTATQACLIPIPQIPAVIPPEFLKLAGETFGQCSPAVAGAAPEAVERFLVAADAASPVWVGQADRCTVLPRAIAVKLGAAPAMCQAVAGPRPEALERMVAPSVGQSMAPQNQLRMLPLELAASHDTALPKFRAQPLAPSVRQPGTTPLGMAAPHPIDTLTVAAPLLTALKLDSALPHPGMLPVEFHSHRLRSVPVGRPEPLSTPTTLVLPRFQVRPAFDKPEELVQAQKPPRKEAETAILNMPAAKRPPTVLMVLGRVAAGFLLAASLWFSLTHDRGDRRLTATETAGEAVVSAENSVKAGDPVSKAAPKGPVARLRNRIEQRATLRIAENFHGTENWESDRKARPEGWTRHQDGYMNTGALAFFRPTLKFVDYRLEFFGQIEAKSIGWTVRSANAKNYHAIKLNVVEAGVRPFVALMHYDVVDGKAGPRTQTPLNIMVHNNTPMQFAVEVKGNRFVTSIDGEEVDAYVDNKLPAGGVGFFSEAGERARLYWIRVTRNDDWLGHVCAMLSEGAATAELHRPKYPRLPVPGLPGGGDEGTLAAVRMGLPYLGIARRRQFLKTWRSQPWNT